MLIKLVRTSITRCFSALFASVLGLEGLDSSGLVCAVGASVGRFLLGPNFNIDEQLSVECCASRTMQRISIFIEIQ